MAGAAPTAASSECEIGAAKGTGADDPDDSGKSVLSTRARFAVVDVMPLGFLRVPCVSIAWLAITMVQLRGVEMRRQCVAFSKFATCSQDTLTPAHWNTRSHNRDRSRGQATHVV